MTLNFDNLQISTQEIEDIIEINILGEIELNLYRGLILRNSQTLFNFILSELFLLVFSSILVLPISLIIIRNFWGESGNDVAQFLLILAIALGLIVIVNTYLVAQAIKMKSLAKLLESIDKYNQIITTLKIFKKLSLSNSEKSLIIEQPEQIFEAFNLTKITLINALKVEAIFRKHHKLIRKRDELLANLEYNLNHLMSFEFNNSSSEYEQLLNQTLEIGMTVHREVKKLQSKI